MDTPQECNAFTEKLNWAPTSVKSPLNVGDDLPDFKKQSKGYTVKPPLTTSLL